MTTTQKVPRRKRKLGIHISKNTNLANDIAIFEKEGLTLNNRYFEVAPKVVVDDIE